MIRKAGHEDKEVMEIVDDISENCKICTLSSKPAPRPKVCQPRATEFNHIVSLDLKDLSKTEGVYILYIICEFTTFTKGVVIKDKKPKTVIESIHKNWVVGDGSGPGLPASWFSDNGGEFCNREMEEYAGKFNIKLKNTGSYSGWMNGHNERNHATCDLTIKKLRMEDPDLKLEEAVKLAVYAKNSAINYLGFSAFQLVYGKNPRLPGIEDGTPVSLDGIFRHD